MSLYFPLCKIEIKTLFKVTVRSKYIHMYGPAQFLVHISGIFYYSSPWLIKVKNRKKKGKDKRRLGGEIGRESNRIRETVIEEKTE